MQLSAIEQRVLGCLIEKQRTTPDAYPLSLNSLRAACNQTTNRDPVMAVDEDQVREACTSLHRHELARIAAAGSGSRATKYRHLAKERFEAGDDELAILCVLLLRGPQTLGELRTRTERMHPFESLDAVHATLEGLAARGLTALLEREPGRKERRYAHQLGDQAMAEELPESPAGPAAASVTAASPTAAGASLDELLARVAALEARVDELEELIAD